MVLLHFKIVSNNYPQDSRVLKTFDSEFSYVEVWFTDKNSKPLEIEDKINITLNINQSVKYEKNKAVFNST